MFVVGFEMKGAAFKQDKRQKFNFILFIDFTQNNNQHLHSFFITFNDNRSK